MKLKLRCSFATLRQMVTMTSTAVKCKENLLLRTDMVMAEKVNVITA